MMNVLSTRYTIMALYNPNNETIAGPNKRPVIRRLFMVLGIPLI
jgi:hypothetical protein